MVSTVFFGQQQFEGLELRYSSWMKLYIQDANNH